MARDITKKSRSTFSIKLCVYRNYIELRSMISRCELYLSRKIDDLKIEVKKVYHKSIGHTKSFVFLPNKISRSSNYHRATLSGLR